MSMLIVENGKMMTFMEFLMMESLGPSKIQFGTDDALSDEEIGESDGFLYTFFKGKYFYCSFLSPGNEVGFGVSEKFSVEPADYDDSRKNTREALRVFNGFIWTALQLAKEKGIYEVKFAGNDPALGVVYDRMVKNSFFLDKMTALGWHYYGKTDPFHVFRKEGFLPQ